ncbi:MAG: bifunctional DNA-formamidopyrimidine glycosylase/DNA-(apurinic or apyrimidinic site) lyase [Chloroflexota bacterium]
MPELPEVETIARNLRPVIAGQEITAAQLLWARTLVEPGVEAFFLRVANRVVREIGRRGKYLLFHLGEDTLIIHLRMSGDLIVRPAGAPPARHDRLILTFGKRCPAVSLAFNDARKFGRAWLVSDPKTVLGGLGPEPLSDTFTAGEFHRRLQAHRRQIKPLLLDQSFLAGIGNIYADESLHAAGIHPLTASQAITPAQAEKLWQSLRATLNEGIRRNGASIDWVYRGGDFQNYFRVYRRTGQPCRACGTSVVRIVVGQRGTHFCPQCQPKSA